MSLAVVSCAGTTRSPGSALASAARSASGGSVEPASSTRARYLLSPIAPMLITSAPPLQRVSPFQSRVAAFSEGLSVARHLVCSHPPGMNPSAEESARATPRCRGGSWGGQPELSQCQWLECRAELVAQCRGGGVERDREVARVGDALGGGQFGRMASEVPGTRSSIEIRPAISPLSL